MQCRKTWVRFWWCILCLKKKEIDFMKSSYPIFVYDFQLFHLKRTFSSAWEKSLFKKVDWRLEGVIYHSTNSLFFKRLLWNFFSGLWRWLKVFSSFRSKVTKAAKHSKYTFWERKWWEMFRSVLATLDCNGTEEVTLRNWNFSHAYFA